MKTDKESRDFIIVMIMFIVVALATFIGLQSCSAKTATSNLPEKELSVQAKCDSIRHAYNRVLHRVWIENPSYVEDVLNESDEYIDLQEQLSEDDLDEIYTFYDEEDSMTYKYNWESQADAPYYVRVVKHIVPEIPEPTKSRLQEVFGAFSNEN